MIDVRVETVVRKPRGEVAAYMFDPRNDAVWTTGVIECRPLSDGPLVAGSRVERISKFLGRRFGYVYEVAAVDPERSVEMHVAEPFPMKIWYTLDDVPEGTRVEIHTAGDATGFFRLASPLMAPLVRRNIANDLALLKEVLEGGARLEAGG